MDGEAGTGAHHDTAEKPERRGSRSGVKSRSPSRGKSHHHDRLDAFRRIERGLKHPSERFVT